MGWPKSSTGTWMGWVSMKLKTEIQYYVNNNNDKTLDIDIKVQKWLL